jgi:hypothetical protein
LNLSDLRLNEFDNAQIMLLRLFLNCGELFIVYKKYDIIIAWRPVIDPIDWAGWAQEKP